MTPPDSEDLAPLALFSYRLLGIGFLAAIYGAFVLAADGAGGSLTGALTDPVAVVVLVGRVGLAIVGLIVAWSPVDSRGARALVLALHFVLWPYLFAAVGSVVSVEQDWIRVLFDLQWRIPAALSALYFVLVFPHRFDLEQLVPALEIEEYPRLRRFCRQVLGLGDHWLAFVVVGVSSTIPLAIAKAGMDRRRLSVVVDSVLEDGATIPGWVEVGFQAALGIPIVLAGVVATVAFPLLYARIRVGDERQRASAVVVVAGLVGTLAVYLSGAVFALLASGEEGFALGASIVDAAPVVLAGFLAFAILRRGYLDERLVLRVTALYGALGLIVVALFQAIEFGLSQYLLSQLPLPSASSDWLAALCVAALMRPMHYQVSSRLRKWMADLRPDVGAEASEPVALLLIGVGDESSVATATAEVVEEVELLFESSLRRSANKGDGRVIGPHWPGWLVAFDASETAVESARGVGRTFTRAARSLELPAPEPKAAVHVGSIRVEGEHVAGLPVSVVDRLLRLAEPGEVLVAKSGAESDGPNPEPDRPADVVERSGVLTDLDETPIRWSARSRPSSE